MTRSTATGSEAELADGCACFSLRRAARMMAQLYDQALQPVGIKNTQFSLLAALSRHGPAPIVELAERMAMDRTTLTRNLRVLESRALVRRGPGPDGRTRSVSVTPAGRRLLRRAIPHWRRAQARVRESFGDARWLGFRDELADIERLAISLK